MQAPFDADRTWLSTIALLGGNGEGEIQLPVVSGRARLKRGEGYFRTCVIQVLERDGPTSATVAWRDAASCCYGEQLWRRCIARKAGVCALSGQPIATGKAVYRPRRIRPVPRNIEAMILATVIEAIPVEEDV
ncbi:DUF3331 domain-containing protein [Paraburkholderia kirstenboschensis]|uniref:DUF3331 domain-containing protein n=1 Tax=Paraburkholderia kirstenboschensis TaxID=1245436 RepID=A0ABZ0E8B6_9BURK|nr:DUF3331 domain-containing protein [Paraburkholderia kirstenboschensis]WOD13495.1 DUF3331 domain-containing protein [Paraburkholderia kirstenboschensis]